MRVTLTSSPTKMSNRDRYLTKDLVFINRRYKKVIILLSFLLFSSIIFNILQHFGKI